MIDEGKGNQYPFSRSTKLSSFSPLARLPKLLTNISNARGTYSELKVLIWGVMMTFFASHNGLSWGSGSGTATSNAAPAILSAFNASTSAVWSTTRPLATLIRKHFPFGLGFSDRTCSSSDEIKFVVDGKSGIDNTRMSRPRERKRWSDDLSVPLIHVEGIAPEGSPVPGIVYRWSTWESASGRGEAVRAIMEHPNAENSRETGKSKLNGVQNLTFKRSVVIVTWSACLPCLPMPP